MTVTNDYLNKVIVSSYFVLNFVLSVCKGSLQKRLSNHVRFWLSPRFGYDYVQLLGCYGRKPLMTEIEHDTSFV